MEFFQDLISLMQEIFQEMFELKIHEIRNFWIDNKPSCCPECNKYPLSKEISDNTLRIHLPLGNAPVNLAEELNKYFAAEVSDIGEGKRCEHCCCHGESCNHNGDARYKSRRFGRQKKLVKAPPIFIVQAQRGINENRKMNLVTSPQVIHIHGKYEYVLDAIICHAGVHYYAKLRKNEKWYICNDANLPRCVGESLNSADDYIFIYASKASTCIPTYIPTAEWQELPEGDIALPRYVEQKFSLNGSRQARISPAYQIKIMKKREKIKALEDDIRHEVKYNLKEKVEKPKQQYVICSKELD